MRQMRFGLLKERRKHNLSAHGIMANNLLGDATLL